MMPGMINPSTGRFQSTPYSVGAGIDSYYEYLLKQWIQSGKTENKYYSHTLTHSHTHMHTHTSQDTL